MRFQHILLALLCTSSIITTANAGLDEAVAAHNAGNFALATAKFLEAAEQGNPKAQFSLGVMHANVRGGVPENLPQAAYWYRKAAEQGNTTAQYNLDVMYAKGQGVAQNATQAAHWYRKASEHGFAIAQSKLGASYMHGRGVSQNWTIAYALFNLVMAKDNSPSAAKNQAIAAEQLTPEQLEAAQQLTTELAIHKNLCKAIDAYLKNTI